MKRTITIRTQFEGFHSWPAAPPTRSYLADSHRHIFHVEVSIETHHNEREIEFHDLLDEVQVARRLIPHRSEWSCESMAEVIGERIGDQHPNRWLKVSVFEDGENGSSLEWEAED